MYQKPDIFCIFVCPPLPLSVVVVPVCCDTQAREIIHNAGDYTQRAKLDANSTLRMLILIGWIEESYYVCDPQIHLLGVLEMHVVESR